MRICANCGAEIPEGYKFCAKCGTPVPSDETANKAETPEDNVTENVNKSEESTDKAEQPDETKKPVDKTEKTADKTKTPADKTEKTTDKQEESANDTDTDNKSKGKSTPKMKWHHFIIYVDLFLAVIIYLILALISGTGSMYLDDLPAIYALYPGMQALNILVAVFYLIMAVMAIVTRQRLAHHKKNGPGRYIRWLWAALIGWVVYETIVCMITGRLTIFLSAYSIQEFAIYTGVPTLVMVIYIFFNMLYYRRKKRKALFVK